MIYKNVEFCSLSQQQVAEAFRKSDRTIRQWTVWGMPRNDDGSYRLWSVIDWFAEHQRNGVVLRPWET
jgi:hypothetical protein